MENELYHYGVKGMKWGVRKTYTTDKIGGNYTDRQKRRMTKQAIRILNKESGEAAKLDSKYLRKANKSDQKADRYFEKWDETGSEKHFEKWRKQDDKTDYYRDKSVDAEERAKKAMEKSIAIQQGRLKAGEDFVTNMEQKMNVPLFMLLGPMGAPLVIKTKERVDFAD